MRALGRFGLLPTAILLGGMGFGLVSVPAAQSPCPRLEGMGQKGKLAKGDAEPGTVIGQVLLPDGNGMRDAQAFLHGSPGPLQGALTDSVGMFRIDSITTGERVIRIQQLGFNTQDHHVRVLAGATDVICAVLSYEQLDLMPVVPMAR